MWSQLLRWRSRPAGTVTTTARPLINRLPPEVLGRCFERLELSDRIRAASVCGYWRSVALDHAQLWCDLDNVDMDALPDLLARTKRAGVRLVVHEVKNFSIELLCDALNPHMDHMRHLDLWLDPHAGRKSFNQLEYLLCSPAPLLETFSLVLEGAAMSLGTMLLGGVAPNLRSLRMHGWYFQGPSSRARQSVAALHTDACPTTHTSAWYYMFPALRELHLYDVSDPDWLSWPGNPFPAHVRTLVLEFSKYAPPDVFDNAFARLQQANFTNLDELTLVNADDPLVSLVIQALGAVVSLELLDCGPHVRLVTATGRAVNFMRTYVDARELENALLPRAGSLRELHVDCGHFETCTLARISRIAPRIERLVLTLGAGDANPMGVLGSPQLPALRELRLQGAPHVLFRVEVFAYLVSTLPVLAPPPRLTLAGVEIVGERAPLDGVLKAQFSEIREIPHSETERTQRAEIFLAPIASGSDSEDSLGYEAEHSDSEDSGYWSPTPYGTYWK